MAGMAGAVGVNRGGGVPEVSGRWSGGEISPQGIRMPARGHSIQGCWGWGSIVRGRLIPMPSDQVEGRELRFIL